MVVGAILLLTTVMLEAVSDNQLITTIELVKPFMITTPVCKLTIPPAIPTPLVTMFQQTGSGPFHRPPILLLVALLKTQVTLVPLMLALLKVLLSKLIWKKVEV